jgi:hypothetical protein
MTPPLGPRAAPYAWTRPLVYCHAAVPLAFRRRVRHRIQRHLLSSLPAARAIQHCASWRSYNRHRPHQSRQQRPPDIETHSVRDVADLRSVR